MNREELKNKCLDEYPRTYDTRNPETVTSYNEGFDDGFKRGYYCGWDDADKFPDWHEYPTEFPQEDDWYLVYAPDYKGGSSSKKEKHKDIMFAKYSRGKFSIGSDLVKKWKTII